jgi:multiple sugar transport system ATP-binding protein
VGVRPEDIDLHTSGKGIPATVELVEELGADGYLYCTADIGGESTEIVARVDGRDHPMKGDKVHLTPIDRHVHVFDQSTGQRLNREVVPSK